jgi:DMSO reductase anchor subunit
MRPALSVIFFTVLSGAGLGLFALLAVAQLGGSPAALGPATSLMGGMLALGLVAAGLASSSLHLANPKNAWRALARVRSSWLSREALLAMIFFPVALGYLAAVHFELATSVQITLGLLGVGLAWATLFSTGMIYACLKTIPQWNDRLVPAAYLVNGHLSGALILLALAAADRRPTLGYTPSPLAGEGWGEGYVAIVLVALVLAAAIKWVYFRKFAAPGAGGHSAASAIGMTAAQARLLDAGHTHGTFLTHEFLFQLGRSRARQLRAVSFLLSLVIPALVIALGGGDPLILGATALLCLSGLIIERWLFFAEAQHVVRLFHGQPSV